MRTDKQCHICREDFNDDWECSTLCVHDECLRHLRDELKSEKEKFRIAVIHASEYKAWVEKAETELATERLALQIACDCLNARRTRYDDHLPNVTPDTFREKAK